MPHGEKNRLKALRRLKILDTPAEGRFDRITRLTRRHFDVPLAQITLVDEKRLWLKSSAGQLGATEYPRHPSFCDQALHSPDGLLVITDTQADPAQVDNPLVSGASGIRFYAGKVCSFEGQAVGTLCILDKQPRQLDSAARQDLCDLATWVESEFTTHNFSHTQRELLNEIDNLRQKAMIDPLTQAWNRAGLEEIYARELAQARREGTSLGVIMADLDFFKQVNDTFGHAAGDVVLRRVADRIRLTIRPYDALARVGGEEFLLLLPNSSLTESATAAERIRLAVASRPIRRPDGDPIAITLSLGVTAISPGRHGDYSLSKVSQLADQCLYAAKGAGRNCVKVAGWNSREEHVRNDEYHSHRS